MRQQIDISQVLRDIRSALQALGYDPCAHVVRVLFPLDRPATQFEVTMDGDSFGIWDAQRCTFVD